MTALHASDAGRRVYETMGFGETNEMLHIVESISRQFKVLLSAESQPGHRSRVASITPVYPLTSAMYTPRVMQVFAILAGCGTGHTDGRAAA